MKTELIHKEEDFEVYLTFDESIEYPFEKTELNLSDYALFIPQGTAFDKEYKVNYPPTA